MWYLEIGKELYIYCALLANFKDSMLIENLEHWN